MKNNLDYYKKNAEEDYMKVPISVLRYISELEKAQQSAPLDVQKIREKFFKECVTIYENEHGKPLTTRITISPNDLLNWFSPYLKEAEQKEETKLLTGFNISVIENNIACQDGKAVLMLSSNDFKNYVKTNTGT